MRRELLERLLCPFTGSRLELESVLSEQGSAIDSGIVSSEAGQFPIISGILRLRADELQEPLVALLRAGRQGEALKAALEVPFLGRKGAVVSSLWRRAVRGFKLGSSAHAIGPGKEHLYRVVTQRETTLTQCTAAAGAESWAHWQVSRFSMPTFLAVHALAHVATGCRTILDFGCGLGHSSFLMKQVSSNAEIVCADYSFTSLYLGKRFLLADAQYVCLDGEYPMPFPGGYFNCIFSTDAIQYIPPKVGLAREFRRVLSENGTIALAHLHNRLSPVKGPGTTLTPDGYLGLFDGMVRRLYPEETIVDDYVADGALKLDRVCTATELNQAHGGVSLVAANSDSVFRTHSGILDAGIDAMRHPSVNPVYRARRSDGAWVFERRIGPPFAVSRTIQGREILPQVWREKSSLETADILALRETDKATLRELVRRFLILELPTSYASKDSVHADRPENIVRDQQPTAAGN